MNNLTEKQQFVFETIKQFQGLSRDCPQGDFDILEDTPDDPPDVIFREADLGVEVTRFFHGYSSSKSTPMGTEKEQDNAMEKAREIYEKLDLPPLKVAFAWHPDCDIKQAIVDKIAREIVNIVKQKVSADSTENRFSVGWHDFQSTILENNISRIQIECSNENCWYRWRVGYPYVECKEIQKITTKKETDKNGLAKMQLKTKTNWLLIVATEDDLSSTADLPADCCVDTNFDRVFFMWTKFSLSIREIKCSD